MCDFQAMPLKERAVSFCFPPSCQLHVMTGVGAFGPWCLKAAHWVAEQQIRRVATLAFYHLPTFYTIGK